MMMMKIGLGGIAEGIVLGGGRKAAAHGYGAHIGIEGCVGDGKVSKLAWVVVSEVERVAARVTDAAVLCCAVMPLLPPNFKFYRAPNLNFTLD